MSKERKSILGRKVRPLVIRSHMSVQYASSIGGMSLLD